MDRRWSCRAEGRNRERHGETMIVVGVHLAAMQAPRRSDVETVWLLLDIGAHTAETVGEGRDSIALFDSQLLCARYG